MESESVCRRAVLGEWTAFCILSLLGYLLCFALSQCLWLVHGLAVVSGGRVHVCVLSRVGHRTLGQCLRGDRVSAERLLYCQRGLHDDHRGGGVAAVVAGC